MNRQHQHEEVLLGPYVLGVLDGAEARTIEEHLAVCQECSVEVAALRELEAALGEVPQEAFLDGPPQGGDLLLQRTLRQMRTERAATTRRRRTLVGLAAAAAFAGVFWAGATSGSQAPPVALPLPTPTATTTTLASPPPGTMMASATDAASGARLTVRVTPAAAWVRVHATVTGLPPGERCTLMVVGRDGSRTPAGSWVVGARAHPGESKGTSLDGSAAVDPADVTAVVVENEAGRRFVSVPV
ncbi:zf-HC2 domain-containing protein [Streptomyces sp. NPDC056632]|uniref:zf-HC2 domain-containing protein n=1 Tax=Streptomyces sp. NPDC056632 TaxID=3345884 RepID=UPI003689B7D1